MDAKRAAPGRQTLTNLWIPQIRCLRRSRKGNNEWFSGVVDQTMLFVYLSRWVPHAAQGCGNPPVRTHHTGFFVGDPGKTLAQPRNMTGRAGNGRMIAILCG